MEPKCHGGLTFYSNVKGRRKLVAAVFLLPIVFTMKFFILSFYNYFFFLLISSLSMAVFEIVAS